MRKSILKKQTPRRKSRYDMYRSETEESSAESFYSSDDYTDVESTPRNGRKGKRDLWKRKDRKNISQQTIDKIKERLQK